MTPDVTVLGKVIGGGLPAAAYAGPRELMERVAPAGDVYQAGTLSGNPLATAAGLATLGLLDAAAYEQLERTTRRLAEGLEQALDVPVQIAWTTGLLTVFFAEAPVTSFEDAQRCDRDTHAAFCRALLERGVYPPPSQFEAWFPSLAHTDEHVDRTVEAAARRRCEHAAGTGRGSRSGAGRARRGRPGTGPVRQCDQSHTRLRAGGGAGGLRAALRHPARLRGARRGPAPAGRRCPLRPGFVPFGGGRGPGGGGRAGGPDHRLRPGPGRRGAGDRRARLGGLARSGWRDWRRARARAALVSF